MPFVKGKSGNKSGKPKGAKNKKTLEWEEFGKQLIQYGLPRAFKVLQKSSDDKFIFYFKELLEYFKPKLARTELTGKEGQELFKGDVFAKVRENSGLPPLSNK